LLACSGFSGSDAECSSIDSCLSKSLTLEARKAQSLMRVLRKFGLRAVRSILAGRGYVVIHPHTVYFEIDGDYLDAIYSPGNPYTGRRLWQPGFCVDIGITRTIMGFSFSQSGWNPHTATLGQYQLLGDRIRYEDSILKEYYDLFQPRNSLETFQIDEGQGSLATQSFKEDFILPWYYGKPGLSIHGEGWIFSGPVSIQMGTAELYRTIRVYDSIKEEGYLPGKYRRSSRDFHEDHIHGYLLKKGKNYRFIIVGGNHRAAALSALGWNELPVTFIAGYPRVVDIQNIEEWPQVRKGNITISAAQEIFNCYFDSDGSETANRLGFGLLSASEGPVLS